MSSFEEKIRSSDIHVLLRDRPFMQEVYERYSKTFKKTVDKRCENKAIAYILALKKHTKMDKKQKTNAKKAQNEELENKNAAQKEEEAQNEGKFKLRKGVMIPIPGTSDAYSEYNITDKIAEELLTENPKRRVLFKEVPAEFDKELKKS